ncbi:MAG: DUF302 domain-containing protein [Marivibrio sp.]|uniref:DUF302 domain-containing protein n=1 Tax=Marivibrio sp. TaxID=2039719 RepID=UPI0032ED7145
MTIRPPFAAPAAALALAAALWAAGPPPAAAEAGYPYDGVRVIETQKSYADLVAAFNQAVAAQERVFVVTRASATVGVRNRFGEEIPGNMVAGVYGPEFAKRMLEASIPAGIEAPIRFYLTEDPETGLATLTYRTPSAVFAPYDGAGLAEMAAELDAIFAEIATAATR